MNGFWDFSIAKLLLYDQDFIRVYQGFKNSGKTTSFKKDEKV
jgi:hypothetical protein